MKNLEGQIISTEIAYKGIERYWTSDAARKLLWERPPQYVCRETTGAISLVSSREDCASGRSEEFMKACAWQRYNGAITVPGRVSTVGGNKFCLMFSPENVIGNKWSYNPNTNEYISEVLSRGL